MQDRLRSVDYLCMLSNTAMLLDTVTQAFFAVSVARRSSQVWIAHFTGFRQHDGCLIFEAILMGS